MIGTYAGTWLGITIYRIVKICRIYRNNVNRERSVFLAVIISPVTDPHISKMYHGVDWEIGAVERGEDDGKRFVHCLGLNC